MGSPKAKTVGGGAAKNTATGFNDFLMQGLTTGQFGNVADPRIAQGQGLANTGAAMQNKGGIFGGLGNQMTQYGQQLQGQAYNNGVNNSTAQSQAQTNLMGGAINSLLGGSPNGMIDSNQFLGQLGQINQNSPQFQQASMTQLGTNFSPDSLMGQFGNVFGGGQSTDLGEIGGLLKQFTSGMGGGGGGVGAEAFKYNPNQLLNYNTNSPEFQAISQLAAQRKQQDVANLRGRYGALGGALSTAASGAEGQYLSQANPQEILALGQLGRQMQEMDLGQQQVNNNLRTGLLSQQVQNSLGQGQLANANQGNMLQALSSIYGQNLGYNMGRGNSLIGAGQQDIANQFNAFGANSQNQQQNNQNAFNQAQAQNQFNQNNFQQQSANSLGVGGIGAQLQQLAQSGQLGALGQLFGAYGQSNQLGTPQAQTMIQPSGFSQALGALTGVAGIAGGLMGGNPLAIGGGLSQLGNMGGGQLLGGSTPFMNGNTGGLFQGQNLGMSQQGINPSSLFAPQTGGPMMQSAFPNMMNAPQQQFGSFGTNPQLRALLGY